MNQNDISAILPVEGQTEVHYLQSSNIISKQISEQKIQNVAVPSKEYPNIFYSKQSLKNLLQQRSMVYNTLKLNLKSIGSKKYEPQIPIQIMQKLIKQMFEQFPVVFDPLHFVFIFDYKATYGFFSADGRYVPMCKKCNTSVYIIIRVDVIKLTCTNSQCKTKLLAQFVIQKNINEVKRNSMKTERTITQKSSKKIQTQALQQDGVVDTKKRKLTLQQINKIRKTVNKLAYQ